MADPEGAMVIAQVSSDIWWGPALMAAVCIICTAGAMSICSVRWGRSRSKEKPRPVPEWQRAGWPPPMDPPGILPPQVVPDGLSDGGGSDDVGSEDGEAHHEPPLSGAAGVPVLSAPTSQPVVQGQPVGGGVLHPPLGEWLESIGVAGHHPGWLTLDTSAR